MSNFEYRVTLYPAETFREMVLFCSRDGGCSSEVVPSEQIRKVESLLNEGGIEGWEMVQASFGKDGLLVFWKRQLA